MHMSVNFHCVESHMKVSHEDYSLVKAASGRAYTCATITDDDGNHVNILLPHGARIALSMPGVNSAETATDEAKG